MCWESVWELVWLLYPGAQVSSLIKARLCDTAVAALGVRMPWSTLAVGWSLCRREDGLAVASDMVFLLRKPRFLVSARKEFKNGLRRKTKDSLSPVRSNRSNMGSCQEEG